jgi:hypothetical protein
LRIKSLGFRIRGLLRFRSKVLDHSFRADLHRVSPVSGACEALGSRMQELGFKGLGLGLRIEGLGFRVYELALRDEGLRFGV